MLAALGLALSQAEEPVIKAAGVILGAFGTLLMGLAAKDNNVTGGTVQQ